MRISPQFPSNDEILSGDSVTVIDSSTQTVTQNLCANTYSGGNSKFIIADRTTGRTFSGTAVCSTNVNLSVLFDNSTPIDLAVKQVKLVGYGPATAGLVTGCVDGATPNYNYSRQDSYQIFDNDTRNSPSWNGTVMPSPNQGLPLTASVSSGTAGIALFGKDNDGNPLPLTLTATDESVSWPSLTAMTAIDLDMENNQDIICRTISKDGFPVKYDQIYNPWHSLVVKINAAATGSGKYWGWITQLQTAPVDSLTDIVESDIGELNSSSSGCLILNMNELPLPSSHLLLANPQKYYNAVWRGISTESSSSSYLVVTIDGNAQSSSTTGLLTPLTTIGESDEGSESPDTASWVKSDHAVEAWVITRVVYNDSGDQVLYAFARLFTYDTLGMLYSVSAETRVSVDATEVCP